MGEKQNKRQGSWI